MTLFVYPPVTVSTTGLATEATLAALAAEDFATQTTLAQVKASNDRIAGDFLSGVSYDATVQTVNATSNVWTFKTGGVGGTTVKTLTINYVDATKQVITSVVAS